MLKNNSLQEKYPDIATEWHPMKNGEITPSMVYAHSQDIFWWICPHCGYEYEKRVGCIFAYSASKIVVYTTYFSVLYRLIKQARFSNLHDLMPIITYIALLALVSSSFIGTYKQSA